MAAMLNGGIGVDAMLCVSSIVIWNKWYVSNTHLLLDVNCFFHNVKSNPKSNLKCIQHILNSDNNILNFGCDQYGLFPLFVYWLGRLS